MTFDMNEHYRKIARKMRGPLAPVMVPFDQQDRIDHEALGNWVDWAVTQGVPVLWTTGGTSEMVSLTEEEIFDLTRTVCAANAGRAFLITSTPPLWQAHKAIELVKVAREAGATAVKVQLNWQGGPSDDAVVDYYRRVADTTDMPVALDPSPSPYPKSSPSRSILVFDC